MKPSDHPEFFRSPPPEGRSRESSIVLDENGRFWHEGQPLSHPGLERAFASWLTRHPDDGRYILCNGYDWTYLTVEDAAFFVSSVRAQGDTLLLGLSDASEEPLVPGSLHVGKREALYVSVKQGRFIARFTPAAQRALLPFLVESDSGELALELGGKRYPIPMPGPGGAG
jgi:uncharacterized protein